MVREHAAHEQAADRCHFDVGSGGDALFGHAPVVRAWLAFPDDDPQISAGCMLWYPTFSSWEATHGAWVEDLYVRPAFRRHGLGSELLQVLRATVEGRIEWDVGVTNDAARQFYLSLGAAPETDWMKFRWSP